MDPIKIQLAIQGGGAKLIPLLAAMEVIQEFQNNQKIVITNVAGTSAGSIAGSLLAAGVPIPLVIEKLKNLKEDIIQYFPIPKLKGELFKKAKLAHKILYKNLPVWETGPISNQLTELFNKEDVTTIQSVKHKKGINLIIVAADLTQNKEHIFTGKDFVVPSIIHSCGLPYFFTLWAKTDNNTVLVDGGILENFPSTYLNEGDDGQIIGISFQEANRKKAPTNLFQFTSSLLDTAMTHSIDRAKNSVSNILEIKTSINTFEIKKALTKGLGDEYKLVKIQTEEFFNKFVEERRRKPKPPKQSHFQPVNLQQTPAEITENIIKMYEFHHKRFPLKYQEMSLTVTAHSLKKKKKRNDEVVLSLTFKTGEYRVFCHEVGLRTDRDAFLLKEASFEVLDKNGNEVDTFYILSSSSKLIVFFENPLPANEGPFKIICRTSVNDFVSDNKLSLRPIRASGTTDKVMIILKAPKERKIGLQNSRGKDVIVGEEMKRSELIDFEVPNSFEIMGWKTNNLAPNENFIIDIIHR